jgi:hypothetical protein
MTIHLPNETSKLKREIELVSGMIFPSICNHPANKRDKWSAILKVGIYDALEMAQPSSTPHLKKSFIFLFILDLISS